jgi:putative resolvase
MLLTAQQINKLYGFHRNTLLNWEKQGLLKPYRTPGGRRRYRKEEIEKLLGLFAEEFTPKVVLSRARRDKETGSVSEKSDRKA